MTKHDAVKAYFEPKVKEIAGNVLNFNFSLECTDSIGLVTNYADKTVKEFINGDARKAYGFSILITKSYSTYSDDLNLEAMNFAQTFMDWLDEQNCKKEYPDFGSNCEVEKIEVLQNMPNLAGVNAEEGTARYMVQCRILHIEHDKNRFGL